MALEFIGGFANGFLNQKFYAEDCYQQAVREQLAQLEQQLAFIDWVKQSNSYNTCAYCRSIRREELTNCRNCGAPISTLSTSGRSA